MKKTRKRSKGRNNKTKHKVNCSPKAKAEVNDFSCYTDNTLYKLRERWNLRHPDAKIRSNDTKVIHKQLMKYFKGVCNKESCWLKQNAEFGDIKNELTDSFAPASPADWKTNPNKWLTTSDIMKVMKQYEKAYKHFDFLGPSPINFDSRKNNNEFVWDELRNFNLAQQIKNGKTMIGMIFNTDPHYSTGQHWISMFVDIKKGIIFFFDSAGKQIPNQVMTLVEKIKEHGMGLSPPIHFEFDQNHPVEHQYSATECGIYSLFFVVHMLEGKLTKEYLKTHIIKDTYMEKFRKIYFNDSL
jgi:hypothetical protein